MRGPAISFRPVGSRTRSIIVPRHDAHWRRPGSVGGAISNLLKGSPSAVAATRVSPFDPVAFRQSEPFLACKLKFHVELKRTASTCVNHTWLQRTTYTSSTAPCSPAAPTSVPGASRATICCCGVREMDARRTDRGSRAEAPSPIHHTQYYGQRASRIEFDLVSGYRRDQINCKKPGPARGSRTSTTSGSLIGRSGVHVMYHHRRNPG